LRSGGAEASKPSRRPLGSASAIVFHGLSSRSASARSNEPSRQSARPPSPHRRWPLHILPRAAAARRWPEVERWSIRQHQRRHQFRPGVSSHCPQHAACARVVEG
ncbi:hypothetical protein EJB05_28905, partial [Eragrostis curvula]